MKRAASHPMLRHFQETDDDEVEEDEEGEALEFRTKGKSIGDADLITKQVTCMKLNKRETAKPHGSWRQEQRSGAAKLRKQLKMRWAIQKLINEQMGRFQAHYSRAMARTKMADVTQLLMPKWIPAHELAAVYWLGDWRPSTILELLRAMAHSLWDPAGVERALAQLINDIRIEEAVIDEEMAEIQSNCVLHLPFGLVNNEGNVPALARVMSEFKKIHRVVVKAQNLRLKTLELAVQKVLTQIDAAEFLVAFAEIEDSVHDFSIKFKTRKGQENLMLKERVEVLLRDNAILKRAVAIQHERQKENGAWNQEVEQSKQLVAQYQEQLRTLELKNYALRQHLQINSTHGNFYPDVF